MPRLRERLPQIKASAAFWVVDWNGGSLQDGDSVSLESFENDTYHYVSVRDGDHTGQARLLNAVNTYEKFTINITDGSTGTVVYSNDGNAANDHNRVSFRSANGTYMTAMPPDYFDGQILNYATNDTPVSTYVWQGFDVIFVNEFDRNRPTWY